MNNIRSDNTNMCGWGGCKCQHCIDYEEQEYDYCLSSDDEDEDERIYRNTVGMPSPSPTSVMWFEDKQNPKDDRIVFTCLSTGKETYDDGSIVPPPKTKMELLIEKTQAESLRYDESKEAEIRKMVEGVEFKRRMVVVIQKLFRGTLQRFKYHKQIGYCYRPIRLIGTRKKMVLADTKYYTWFKGNQCSSTSRNAWGHRRNGGTKGRIAMEKQSRMLTDKEIELAKIAKKERQVVSKAKREKDAIKLAERNAQITAFLASKQVVQPEAVVVEETEWQKFKKAETEEFKTMVRNRTTLPELVPYIEPVVVSSNRKVDWSVMGLGRKTKKVDDLTKKLFDTSSYRQQKARDRGGGATPHSVSKIIMCRSVSRKFKCTTSSCNYAHTRKELDIRPCRKGSECNRIRSINGTVVSNPSGPSCCFSHYELGETIESYYRRLRIPVDAVVKSDTATRVKPTQGSTSLRGWGEAKKPTVVATVRPSRWGVRPSRWGVQGVVTVDKKVVVRVKTWADIVRAG